MVIIRTFTTKEGYTVFSPRIDFILENRDDEWDSNGLNFRGQMRFYNHQLRKKLGHTPEEMQKIIDQEFLKQELKEVGIDIDEVANDNCVLANIPKPRRLRLVDDNRENCSGVGGE